MKFLIKYVTSVEWQINSVRAGTRRKVCDIWQFEHVPFGAVELSSIKCSAGSQLLQVKIIRGIK